MATIAFTRNYSDRSNDTGYQFEFHCDKCGNGHMSTFKASTLGVASGLLKAAGSLFGGVLNQAAYAGDHVKDALRGGNWDAAFREAVEECKTHFKLCSRCGKWVCPETCWNEARGQCEACAPDLQEEAASIQAHVAVDQIREKIGKHDQTQGMEGTAGKVGSCPHCNARVGSGKFCPECGKPLVAAKAFCSECGKEMAASAKFCGECGTPRKT